MITIIAIFVAGIFVGIAAHQRTMLREARFELSAYQDQEVRQAETLGDLRAQVRAHETSLTMILEAAL